MIVGLTGQTGAGKTTVADQFREYGIPVIDADQISREIVQPQSALLHVLQAAFVEPIIQQDGSLDRRALAKIVFSDSDQLKKLNGIMHPVIRQKMQQQMEELLEKGHTIIVVDAPVLFESGCDQMCDRIVAVIASAEIRLGRIMRRDHIEKEVALLRMNAQKNELFFRTHADFIIENTGDLSLLRWEMSNLIRLLKEIAGAENKDKSK